MSHPASVSLRSFVDEVFLPECLPDCSQGMVHKFHSVVNLYGKHLRREPTLADLRSEPVEGFLTACREGRKKISVDLIRRKLRRIWRHASQTNPDVQPPGCREFAVTDPTGPRPETVAQIYQATAMIVAGQTEAAAAAALGTTPNAIWSARHRHRGLWREAENLAKLQRGVIVTGLQQSPGDFALLSAEGPENSVREDLPDPTPDMRLPEFFDAWAWPFCLEPAGRERRTESAYRTALCYWASLTDNPPIRDITRDHLRRFLNGLKTVTTQRTGGRLSLASVRKHMLVVQRLLQWTGHPDRHNPNGAGLRADVPWLPIPRKEFPSSRPGFTLDQMARWLAVLPEIAEPMPTVDGADPLAWWRALLLVSYNTGMRPGTTFRVEWSMLDGHVLHIPPAIIKGHHGRLVWLNDHALAALEPLRRSAGLVFAWDGWPCRETALRRHLRSQQRAAGIPRLSLYGFRRAFATECGKINPLAMQIAMGHVGLGFQMAANHYINIEAVLAEALSKLPQPGPSDEPQQNAA